MALDALVAARLAAPRWRDSFHATFDGALHDVRVDWPRSVPATELACWIRACDVLIELAHAPAREPFELGLVLHAACATQLVERLLGGTATTAMPSAAGAPSEAECGVLAYAAARLCAAHESALLVRDVRTGLAPESLGHAQLVVWPIALQTSFGRIDGSLLISPALAERSAARHAVDVVVHDTLDPAAPDTLTAGEVWVGDAWPLTWTTEGLTGPVALEAEGTDTRLRALLADHCVRAAGVHGADLSGQCSLVLARLSLTLAEVAALAGGAPMPIARLGSEPARLRVGARTLAEGELVLHRGALGLRVTEPRGD